jgi:enoyl-CoA hydratase
MDDHALAPWMLLADWRAGLPAFLCVDLAAWPPGLALEPLPPVPIIGIGTAHHAGASQVDMLVRTAGEAIRTGAAIAINPATAAVIVQLLRATEAMPAPHALALESLAFAALQGSSEHTGWLASRAAATPQPPGRLHIDRNGNVLTLVMDRPAARNAIDRALRDALFDAFTLTAQDDEIRLVQLRAAGRCFSTGADLAEFGISRDPITAHAIRARALPAWPLLRRKGCFEAHVHGACIGAGLEIAAFADRLTASPNAWFQLPEARMGLLPGFGGCVSVPRRIGRQRAAAMMLSGRRVGAATALDWGLIDAITDDASPAQRQI